MLVERVKEKSAVELEESSVTILHGQKIWRIDEGVMVREGLPFENGLKERRTGRIVSTTRHRRILTSVAQASRSGGVRRGGQIHQSSAATIARGSITL